MIDALGRGVERGQITLVATTLWAFVGLGAVRIVVITGRNSGRYLAVLHGPTAVVGGFATALLFNIGETAIAWYI